MDKMNFEAIDKMCAPCVIDVLETELENAQATKQLLSLTRNILDSFLDKSLEIERRVYLIWNALFFLRLWRAWIKENEQYSLEKNFLTLNAYTCIEINAHSLLAILEKCRKTNSPHLFLPWLYSSQPCEKIFRQARSMTSTYSTVVNFDMLDLLKRLNRIQTINEITTDLG